MYIYTHAILYLHACRYMHVFMQTVHMCVDVFTVFYIHNVITQATAALWSFAGVVVYQSTVKTVSRTLSGPFHRGSTWWGPPHTTTLHLLKQHGNLHFVLTGPSAST